MLTMDMSKIPNIRSLFDQLLEEQLKSAPGYELIIASLMTQIIVHMFRLLEEESQDSLPWLTALQDARLARAINSIFENPGANHSVGSLAEKAGMSRSAFAEHFSASFSRSPINFVNHVRMERAGKMLGEGTSSIDQVANRRRNTKFSKLIDWCPGQNLNLYDLSVSGF